MYEISRRGVMIGSLAMATPASERALPALSLSVTDWMMAASTPAVAIARIGSGATTVEVHGVRKADEADIIISDTPFELASLSKPILAVAALSLAEEGLLDLDRPMHAYVRVSDDARAQRATARHALSHTTGFPNWRRDADVPLESAFEPGTEWSYSGEGYFHLQRVLERVANEPVGRIVRARVLRPAGMSHTSFAWDEQHDREAAWPHDGRGQPLEANATPEIVRPYRQYARAIGQPIEDWSYERQREAIHAAGRSPRPWEFFPNMAASIVAPVDDYARFLLFAAQRQQMQSPAIGVVGPLEWSLGWGLEQMEDGMWAWHHGSSPGVKHFFALNLRTQSGILVCTNAERGARVYERIIRAGLQRDFAAFLMS